MLERLPLVLDPQTRQDAIVLAREVLACTPGVFRSTILEDAYARGPEAVLTLLVALAYLAGDLAQAAGNVTGRTADDVLGYVAEVRSHHPGWN